MIFGDKAVCDINLKRRIIQVQLIPNDWLNNFTPGFAPVVYRPVDPSLEGYNPTGLTHLTHDSKCWKTSVKKIF